MGLAGERVTTVTVWPWERYYPALAKGMTHLCVTTCPDRWMTFLGRGNPGVATPETVARSYVSNDNVQSLTVLDERSDTGFHNAAFDKSLQGTREISYATTHGYQHNSGGHMSLFPAEENLEWLRPFTALGTTAAGDRRSGRFLTQALDPAVRRRLSLCQSGWGMDWSWLPANGSAPQGGLIAACGDHNQGDKWWFVYTDGLYYSPDGGASMANIMDGSGRQ